MSRHTCFAMFSLAQWMLLSSSPTTLISACLYGWRERWFPWGRSIRRGAFWLVLFGEPRRMGSVGIGGVSCPRKTFSAINCPTLWVNVESQEDGDHPTTRAGWSPLRFSHQSDIFINTDPVLHVRPGFLGYRPKCVLFSGRVMSGFQGFWQRVGLWLAGFDVWRSVPRRSTRRGRRLVCRARGRAQKRVRFLLEVSRESYSGTHAVED